MADIREFLLERIAEDEATLQRTGPFPHSTHGRDVFGTYRADCPDCIGVPSRERVLAECAAKRAILRRHATITVWPDGTGGAKYYTGSKQVCASCDERTQTPCPTTRLLATVYKDHPDYQEEWAA